MRMVVHDIHQGRQPMDTKNPPAIVRIHRPDLSPEERAKRMELIHQAAANLILAAKKSTYIGGKKA